MSDVLTMTARSFRLTRRQLDSLFTALALPVLLMLLQWGDKYYLSPEGPPLLLRHGADGHELQPAVTCSCCGEPVSLLEVDYEVVEPQRPSVQAVSAKAS